MKCRIIVKDGMYIPQGFRDTKRSKQWLNFVGAHRGFYNLDDAKYFLKGAEPLRLEDRPNCIAWTGKI